jgi:hypothetical protein
VLSLLLYTGKLIGVQTIGTINLLTVLRFFVETAGKTLEELKEIFEAPNPRKASTKRSKVEMTESGQVLRVHDA